MGNVKIVPLEKEIKACIIQWLQMQKDCFVWAQNNIGVFDAKRNTYRNPGFGQIKGVSDILGIWKGKPLAIEVKRPGGKLSAYQILFLERFRKCGGIAFMAKSIDDVISALSTNLPKTSFTE